MAVNHRHIAHRSPATWAAILALILLAATSLLMARTVHPAEEERTPSPALGGVPLADTWQAAEPDATLRWMEARDARAVLPAGL